MLLAAPPAERRGWHLDSPTPRDWKMLSSQRTSIDGYDEKSRYGGADGHVTPTPTLTLALAPTPYPLPLGTALCDALESVGLSSAERSNLFATFAALLSLGDADLN